MIVKTKIHNASELEEAKPHCLGAWAGLESASCVNLLPPNCHIMGEFVVPWAGGGDQVEGRVAGGQEVMCNESCVTLDHCSRSIIVPTPICLFKGLSILRILL